MPIDLAQLEAELRTRLAPDEATSVLAQFALAESLPFPADAKPGGAYRIVDGEWVEVHHERTDTYEKRSAWDEIAAADVIDEP